MHLFFVYINMEKIRKFKLIEPPEDLFGKVMERIQEERKIAEMKRRLVYVSAFFLFSIFACVPMWNFFKAEATQSGFLQYIGLVFYDFRVIAAYWQDLGLTILETIPAVSIAGMLAVFFAMLISLRFIIRYVQALAKLTHLYYYQ